MNQSFYTASVGASQQQQRLNVHSNNIANVNTNGFKASKPTFSSLMYGNMTGINNQQLPRGTGSRLLMTDLDFTLGPMAATGRLYDYALSESSCFFALSDPQTGEISYTRDGSFALSGYRRPYREGEEGFENAQPGDMKSVYMLSDGEGRFVFGQDGLPLEVDPNDDRPLPIAVYTFDNINGMRQIGNNRFLPADKNGAPQLVETAAPMQGYLEASATDLATELTKVIEAQRSYSYALRMLTTSDEVETTINGLRG